MLITSDPDANDTHTYSVSDTRFTVADNQLTFAENAETNFFDNEVVQLEVISTDSGNLTSTQTFTIRVSDFITTVAPPLLGAAEPDVDNTSVQLELEPTADAAPVANPSSTQTTATTLAEDPEEQQNSEVEEVDLASLIAPLEKITLEEIALLESDIAPLSNNIDTGQISVDINNSLDFEFDAGFDYANSSEFREMAAEFDRQREQLEESQTQYKTLIGSSFTISSGFSVGYLLWLVRGGTLMGSVLSSLPAWRLVDPLPVLGALGDDAFEDEESLETMVDDEPDEPASESEKDAA